MIWYGIVGRNRYEFQNVEDACMRLQIQLPRLSKSTLLILNDIGSRENMEKLLFQVAGYKTLLTFRHRSITPRNHYIQFYQLPLLGQDDVLSLFCFMENLVRHGRVQRPNFPMGNWYLIIISMGYLDSSTPVLDFQWTKKPVQMTVVHLGLCQEAGMAEAFTILLELARRNLLNLISKLRSTAAILYGNVSKLYFSHYYAMRYLALHLGGQGIALHCKEIGLLVPRKGIFCLGNRRC